jgi:hypothetical protein
LLIWFVKTSIFERAFLTPILFRFLSSLPGVRIAFSTDLMISSKSLKKFILDSDATTA